MSLNNQGDRIDSGRAPWSARETAFTLLELLVVVSVIALLAALLMPVFARAKHSARRIVCANNLRQMGIALGSYVEDWHVYPAFQSQARLFRAGFWDSTLKTEARCEPNLFWCPANYAHATTLESNWSPRPPIVVPEDRFKSWPNASYGYNGTGTAEGPFPISSIPGCLFLGFGGELSNDTGTSISPVHVTERQVAAPQDMIALGDYDLWATDDDNDGDLHPGMLFFGLTGRHKGSANVLFCDAHLEFGKTYSWTSWNDEALRRWNLDHLPHANGK